MHPLPCVQRHSEWRPLRRCLILHPHLGKYTIRYDVTVYDALTLGLRYSYHTVLNDPIVPTTSSAVGRDGWTQTTSQTRQDLQATQEEIILRWSPPPADTR